MPLRRFGWLLSVVVLLILPFQASAQMYRWVDEQGRVHYSQGLYSVPERYRSQARRLSFPKAPSRPDASKADRSDSETTTISFNPGSPILVSAKINDRGPLTLVLDTGADRTMIAPLPLWRLGISTRNAARSEVRGVTGTTRVDVVRVDSVEVGKARVGPLLIIAYDAEINNADGLLGRDFLNQFSVSIDAKAGVVTIAPK